jgi:hypothetical protein
VAGPLHWVYVVIDFGSAVLFMASMVGLAVWSHVTARRMGAEEGAGTQAAGARSVERQGVSSPRG